MGHFELKRNKMLHCTQNQQTKDDTISGVQIATNLDAFSESARDAALAATVDGAIVEA